MALDGIVIANLVYELNNTIRVFDTSFLKIL